MPTHMLAEADTRYVGPHWTTTLGNEEAKSADTCRTRCEGRRSCTELLETVTLRKKGERALLFCVYWCNYMAYIQEIKPNWKGMCSKGGTEIAM